MTSLDSVHFLDDVLRRSPTIREHVAPLRNVIVDQYGKYNRPVTLFGVPTKVSGVNGNARERLHHAYRHYVVRDDGYLNGETVHGRLTVEAESCSYCDFGEPSQLDHFLPKDKDGWPEYSIFFENLVPSCARCNNLKHNSTELVHHPVLMARLDRRYVGMQIEIDGLNLSLQYILDFPIDFSKGQCDALEAQFNILRLGERYTKKARNLISSLQGEFLKQYGMGGAAKVRDYLSAMQMIARSRFRVNHWECVALAALVECEEFHTLRHWGC